MKCIYCLTERLDERFNREHVINEAFGKYGNETPTLNCVCEICNQGFGDTIDLELGRDTLFGVKMRYEYGLQGDKEQKKTLNHNRKRMEFYVTDPIHHILLVNSIPKEGNKAEIELASQVHIMNSDKSTLCCFRVGKQLPHKGLLERYGLNIANLHYHLNPSVLENFDNLKAIERRLYACELPLSRHWQLYDISRGKREAIVNISHTIDKNIQRAIAKIAFNYLAYHFKDLVYQEYFNQVRNYIKSGVTPSNYFIVMMDSEAIDLSEKGKEQRNLGHIITIHQQDSIVVNGNPKLIHFH